MTCSYGLHFLQQQDRIEAQGGRNHTTHQKVRPFGTNMEPFDDTDSNRRAGMMATTSEGETDINKNLARMRKRSRR